MGISGLGNIVVSEGTAPGTIARTFPHPESGRHRTCTVFVPMKKSAKRKESEDEEREVSQVI
jgi:hypothetical protein